MAGKNTMSVGTHLCMTTCALFCVFALAPQPARAISINLIYDESVPDRFHSTLFLAANRLANWIADVQTGDANTLEILVRYEDLSSSGSKAQYSTNWIDFHGTSPSLHYCRPNTWRQLALIRSISTALSQSAVSTTRFGMRPIPSHRGSHQPAHSIYGRLFYMN